MPILVILGQTVKAYLWKSAKKYLTPHAHLSRLFKVTGTDTDRLATYDFLLVFHSNYGPRIVFQIKGNVCKIFPPMYI